MSPVASHQPSVAHCGSARVFRWHASPQKMQAGPLLAAPRRGSGCDTRRECALSGRVFVVNAAQSSGQRAAGSHAQAADVPPRGALPDHVAIIMDGAGRWARQRSLPVPCGHQEGVASLRTAVECCQSWGVRALTVFAFSVENWARDDAEVEFLLALVQRTLQAELQALQRGGVRLRFIGELDMLPASLQSAIRRAELQTADNSGLAFTIALSYSGRQDITNAMQELARQVASGTLQPEDISEQLISDHLCTRVIPAGLPPDLIIRSSGEQRLSNFLLWESAYAELYFSNVLWPDFKEEDFAAALRDYAARERRYGRRV